MRCLVTPKHDADPWAELQCWAPMKPDTWEFVRNDDGTYAVLYQGKKACDRIPEKWFDRHICEHYGFCGEEVKEIRRQIDAAGKCVLVL
jgi:hypothetical protein